MPFIPHTNADTASMLSAIGVKSIDELFSEIPTALRYSGFSTIPEGMNESDLLRLFLERASAIKAGFCFLGAGAYEHHIPSLVWDIATRGEFLTSYTPYQAEASQGGLQLLYEYQTMMARLLGMEVSNASLYDGASALAEAALMAVRLRKDKREKILLPSSLHPLYRATVITILRQQNIPCEIIEFSPTTGQTPEACVNAHKEAAALIIAQPNFFGILENVDALTDAAHTAGMLVIACVNPIAMALIKEPGSWGATGADIVCGEGQPLGIPLSSGGPYFGFLATRLENVRQMPGRIVGRTQDAEGEWGYTLTLQAREQHIRRAKATSNICTNQGLLVTAATLYLATLGATGLQKVAAACHHNAIALREMLLHIDGVEPVFEAPFFHEFAIRLPRAPAAMIADLSELGMIAGLDLNEWYPELDNAMLICVTETKTHDDLERFVRAFKEVI